MSIKSEEIMDKSGHINYAYAGGWDTTGIPIWSQMPIYFNDNIYKKWIMGNESNKTQYINSINLTVFIFSNASFKNLNKSNGFNSNL